MFSILVVFIGIFIVTVFGKTPQKSLSPGFHDLPSNAAMKKEFQRNPPSLIELYKRRTEIEGGVSPDNILDPQYVYNDFNNPPEWLIPRKAMPPGLPRTQPPPVLRMIPPPPLSAKSRFSQTSVHQSIINPFLEAGRPPAVPKAWMPMTEFYSSEQIRSKLRQ